MKKLNLALTFDTDDDMFDASLSADINLNQNVPTFTSFLEHAHDIRGLVQEVFGDLHRAIPITWFVRCDDEISYHYGEPTYLLRETSNFLKYEIQNGSQVGFHPHLYNINERGQRSRIISDLELCDQFERSAQQFFYLMPSGKKLVRIGEAFACNALFECIEKHNFTADSSAMPGRFRKDQYRSLDWLGTPNQPYRPSTNDYRIPSYSAASRRAFLEIPFTMLPLMCCYDEKPYLRYVDLSFHHQLIRQQLENFNEDHGYLMTMTHPAGIFPKYAMREHGLLGFGVDNFRQNLLNLRNFSHEHMYEINFVTVGDLANAYS